MRIAIGIFPNTKIEPINRINHIVITSCSFIIQYKKKFASIVKNRNELYANAEKSAYQNGLNIPKKFAFAKANFFREIGYADELGSGFIKITKNSILYSGKPPIFEDKEMLRVTIPLLRDEKLEEKDLINLANGTLKIVF